MRVGCVFFLSRVPGTRLARFAEACLRWTPQIATTGQAVFLEVGGCRGLYGEESLRARLEALGRKFQLRFRLEFGPDPATALACARDGRGECPAGRLPVEAICDYVDPFGLNPEGLGHPAREMAVRLRKLGILSVRDFLALPAETLGSRFGKAGVLVHQRIAEADRIPWPRFSARERILERTEPGFVEGGWESFQELEPLLFALRPMIERAMARLKGRGERASLIRLRLGLEKGWVAGSVAGEGGREWLIRLALPQGSSLGVLRILREKLDSELQGIPLAAPVTELELEIVETVPGRGAQRDFFHAREEEIEAWSSLVARMAGKLGGDKVFIARIVERYPPEKGWVRALAAPEGEGKGGEGKGGEREESASSAVARDLPPRPLRLLPHPEALLRSDAPGGDRDGALFVLSPARPAPGRRREAWRVLEVKGPEILSGEWWFREFQRSYYEVGTHTGERLWVFRSPGSEAFFLHGYFD